MKRKLKFVLSFGLLCSVTSLVGCKKTDPEKEKEQKQIDEVINYTKVDSVTHESMYFKAGETKKITVNYKSGHNDYLKFVVKPEFNVYGTFDYSSVEDASKKVSESFFIEQSEKEVEFTQFLDAFRPEFHDHSNCAAKKAHDFYNIPMKTEMARGLFDKQIDTITLKNTSSKAGNIEIIGFYVSDRKLPMEEVYLTIDPLKIGVDLMGGGTLTYLERLNYKTTKSTYNIDEITTSENTAYIGVDSEHDEGATLGSTDHHVNLINYYDAGRQIQQSYYADVGGSQQRTQGENGYTRKMCYTASSSGYYWPYNPVQGGDCHCNISQVVDFKRTSNSLYIKCKALDWADNNGVTDSYMENWYTIENEKIFAKNRFTNFAGFTEMESCDGHTLELPATYIVHPLNTLVTYQGESPWTDDKSGLIYQDNLGTWKYGADKVYNHPEDWFAWVNQDKFGVGMYIPEVDFYASGRSATTTSLTQSTNTDAYDSPMGNKDKLAYNKKECYYNYQSCYVRNTDYTAPEIKTKMLDYIPFEYSYVLCVDYLDVIRNNFKSVYKNKQVDNSTMFAWDKALQNN